MAGVESNTPSQNRLGSALQGGGADGRPCSSVFAVRDEQRCRGILDPRIEVIQGDSLIPFWRAFRNAKQPLGERGVQVGVGLAVSSVRQCSYQRLLARPPKGVAQGDLEREVGGRAEARKVTYRKQIGGSNRLVARVIPDKVATTGNSA